MILLLYINGRRGGARQDRGAKTVRCTNGAITGEAIAAVRNKGVWTEWFAQNQRAEKPHPNLSRLDTGTGYSMAER